MKLTLEQLKAITTGAVSIVETPEGFRFYRFTEAQRALYATRREALQLKSQASSGMKFSFETDSESFFVSGRFEHASARSYFSLDVAVNGKVIDSLDNFSDVEIPAIYTDIQFPMGHYQKKFDLGPGRKSGYHQLRQIIAITRAYLLDFRQSSINVIKYILTSHLYTVCISVVD